MNSCKHLAAFEAAMARLRELLAATALVSALVCALAGALTYGSPATAQTTSGNATTGQSLWTSKGCSGCHAINARPVNAANAGGHILYAMSQGMPAILTAAEANDAAAYIGQALGTPSTSVLPNSGDNLITLPGIFLNSNYGDLTGIIVITPPTKGTLSIVDTIAHYTPNPGAIGADSFTWQATQGAACTGACSSVRTHLINIGSANDNFSTAIQLSSGRHTINNGSNLGATKEAGEPNHAGNAGGKSAWWTWTARYALPVTVTTTGSNFDTLLAVYTGSAVNALTLVASNNDCGAACSPANTSKVSFTAVAGTTYRIAVDGVNGAAGTIRMELEQPAVPPPNDDFANAIAIVPPATTASGSSLDATLEFAEIFSSGSLSVWWKWTAPASGTMLLNLAGSTDFGIFYPYYTSAEVYIIDALGARVKIGFNDNSNAQGSSVFQAVAGTTYYFRVASTTGNPGIANLTLTPTTNNLFAARILLNGPRAAYAGNNAGATVESGEPGAGTTSVWFRFVARGTSPVMVDTCGSNFNTTLGAYMNFFTSNSVSNQNLIANVDNITPATCATNRIQFTPADNGSYNIRLSGTGSTTGNYVINIFQQQPQSIVFNAISDRVIGSGNVTLVAAASAGAVSSFTSTTTATCAVTGNILTLVAPGTCSVTASHPGNTDYLPGNTTQNFAIVPPQVNFAGLAWSRKTHGSAGAQNILLNNAPIVGNVVIEPRLPGAGHRVVFQFDGPVYNAGGALLLGTDGNSFGSAIPLIVPGSNELTVLLGGVANGARVTVLVEGVNAAGSYVGSSAAVSLGFLVGAVGDGPLVSAADIVAVKTRAGKPVGVGTNARADLDANGTIDQADVAVVKARSGQVMP